ncbi:MULTISPECIES: ABC transporter family substrate-binding protein [Streptosporangium]|uniref:Peptide/nickel transport system substrate-binding protein n=1 Tax=Streptosporangium brasiliense TaxID=47480 RepID=A0ABT9RAI1_9ACTN|nr:ABC transporter family substrate-binding protein [Streptosporangium brasiliense]MDP9866233.1 peptide/nickel transport system substrate-binding protein [Streptosporangium brasiliense]
MFQSRTSGKFLAAVAGGALLLTACAGNDAGTSSPTSPGSASASAPAAQTITYAYEQEFHSYNNNTVAENATRNAGPLQRVLTGFWIYGDKGAITPDKDFGTYEKTSDDPLTVEYTISDKAVWSDGVPIDCDDVMLWWGFKSGKIKGFSSSGNEGVQDTKLPECDKGGKKFSLIYDKPFADWVANGPGATEILPAHVVAKQGGLSEDEFIAAVKDTDAKKLEKSIKFFNDGWVSEGTLPAADLIPSSGPYKLSKMDAGQSLTFVANDKWWGTPAATPTVVERFIALDEQAQALQNREVQIVEPQPGPDVLNQLKAIEGVKVNLSDEYTYEHLDFNFDSSPFKDKALREAFAKCVPRQLIVDNLIKPVAPEAKPLEIRNVAPFQANSAAVISASGGAGVYAQQDIEGAKALLEKAGKTGLEVKVGYQTPNPRRTAAVQLIIDSCNKAGFKVVDKGSEDFFGTVMPANGYDVALYAWAGSSLVSGWASTFTTPKKCDGENKGNNNGCYSSKKVDELITKLNATVDLAAQDPIIAEIEKNLWADLATIPLFQHPGLSAWDEAVQNVVPNPAQSTITWNMDKWSLS